MKRPPRAVGEPGRSRQHRRRRRARRARTPRPASPSRAVAAAPGARVRREQSVEQGLVGVDTEVSGDSAHGFNPRRARSRPLVTVPPRPTGPVPAPVNRTAPARPSSSRGSSPSPTTTRSTTCTRSTRTAAFLAGAVIGVSALAATSRRPRADSWLGRPAPATSSAPACGQPARRPAALRPWSAAARPGSSPRARARRPRRRRPQRGGRGARHPDAGRQPRRPRLTATVVCNGMDVADDRTVPFDTAGDARDRRPDVSLPERLPRAGRAGQPAQQRGARTSPPPAADRRAARARRLTQTREAAPRHEKWPLDVPRPRDVASRTVERRAGQRAPVTPTRWCPAACS